MAVKKIQMRPPDNNYADVLHPETDTTMVLLPDGSVLQDQLIAPLASGSATELVIDMPGITSYTHNKLFQFIASANNNGAATTLKVGTLPARPIYLEGTRTAPNLMAWKLYTVWADNGHNCFFLKASGSGNAVAADLLAGKTATTDNGPIVGTMPINASQNATLEITGSAKPTKVVPAGYTPGGTITAQLSSTLANKILAGNNIGGVNGTIPNYSGQTQSLLNHSAAMTVTVDPNDNRMGVITAPNQLMPPGYVDGTTKLTLQLWGLIPKNIRKGVAVGQYPGYGGGYMTGEYDGKLDIETYLANLPTGYIPLGFDEAEQLLYCAESGIYGDGAHCFDASGTKIKSLYKNGYGGSSIVSVSPNYLLWSMSYLTDKAGTVIRHFYPGNICRYGAINEQSRRFFGVTGVHYNIHTMDLDTGTLIKSVKSPINTYSDSAHAFIPMSNGCLVIGGTTSPYDLQMVYVKSDGNIMSINGSTAGFYPGLIANMCK